MDQNLWRACEDDVIGGWCIVPADDRRTPAEGARQVANFVSRGDAEHIANLHNAHIELHLDGRPDWDDYFLLVTEVISLRADCSRRRVGAVIVKDNRIRATGYNGSPAGGPSCLAGECPRGVSDVAPGSSYDTGAGACIALHAEQNACLYGSRDDCEGATIYVNQEPCDGCRRMIVGSGLVRVVWPDGVAEIRDGKWKQVTAA